MRRALLLIVIALVATMSLSSSAQAYKQIGNTNCIVRATAPTDLNGGDNTSEPWSGYGEIDCDTSHFLSLNVILYQLLQDGWDPIFSSSNTKDVNASFVDLHSQTIPYLTRRRWYCTRAGATVGSYNAQSTVYRSRSIMVDGSGVHFGTC